MRFSDEKRQVLLDLDSVLEDVERSGDVIVVEGARDVEALRSLGFLGRIEICSKVRVSDSDLVEELADLGEAVVILTDFDNEGKLLNKRLSRLLELRGVKVRKSLRRSVSRLMAALGVYAIEAINNLDEKLQDVGS